MGAENICLLSGGGVGGCRGGGGGGGGVRMLSKAVTASHSLLFSIRFTSTTATKLSISILDKLKRLS